MTNLRLGVSARDFAQTGDGRYLGFFVEEGWQGYTDMNGDGDNLDPIFHVLDVRTGALVNHGLSCVDESLRGRGWGFEWTLREDIHGNRDFNGDGDGEDLLPVIVDPTDLAGGLSIYSHPGDTVLLERPWVGVRTSEDGVDLDGDGRFFNSLASAWNTATEDVTHLSILNVRSLLAANGTSFLFLANELDDQDLNGDGSYWDINWLLSYDTAVEELYFTGLTAHRAPMTAGGLEAIYVDETNDSGSLNGDADLFDRVLSVFDKSTFTLQETGLAVREAHVFDENGGAHGLVSAISGDLVAFPVDENHHGQDLNGNGLVDGAILHIHDVSTNTTTNVELAVFHGTFEGDFFVFEVREEQQLEDLNGDGDMEDFVLHVRSSTTGVTINLGVTTQDRRSERLQTSHGLVAFKLFEGDQGADMNGNGRLDDEVLYLYDLASERLTNTRIAVQGEIFLGDHAVFYTQDEDVAGDLNADGDTDDRLLFVYDVLVDRAFPTGLSISQVAQVMGRRAFALVSERDDDVDLNADGDTRDPFVLHEVRLRR